MSESESKSMLSHIGKIIPIIAAIVAIIGTIIGVINRIYENKGEKIENAEKKYEYLHSNYRDSYSKIDNFILSPEIIQLINEKKQKNKPFVLLK